MATTRQPREPSPFKHTSSWHLGLHNGKNNGYMSKKATEATCEIKEQEIIIKNKANPQGQALFRDPKDDTPLEIWGEWPNDRGYSKFTKIHSTMMMEQHVWGTNDRECTTSIWCKEKSNKWDESDKNKKSWSGKKTDDNWGDWTKHNPGGAEASGASASGGTNAPEGHAPDGSKQNEAQDKGKSSGGEGDSAGGAGTYDGKGDVPMEAAPATNNNDQMQEAGQESKEEAFDPSNPWKGLR